MVEDVVVEVESQLRGGEAGMRWRPESVAMACDEGPGA